MLKLAILFLTFVFASGAIFYLPDLSHLDDNNVETPVKLTLKNVEEGKGQNIWVLKLNDEGLNLKTLRTASEKEEVVFERVVGPMIEAYKYRPVRVLREPAKTNETAQESRAVNEKRNMKMKKEMMRLINKFAMSIASDPDAFLSESESEESSGPSLILYIKGAYTSLTVSSDLKEWHFFIPPPSPLPGWLYRQRDEGSVDIPDDVRDQLFVKLLHLLRMFLGIHV